MPDNKNLHNTGVRGAGSGTSTKGSGTSGNRSGNAQGNYSQNGRVTTTSSSPSPGHKGGNKS